MSLTDPFNVSMRTHAQQELRILNPHSSEPSVLPVWPMYCRCQHPAHGTLYTSTLLWFAGTGSLGCTTSCRRVVKGWKGTWMAGWGDPMDGFG